MRPREPIDHLPTQRRSPLQAGVAFVDLDPLTLAASIAFYSALSFAPILVLSLAIAAELWPGSEYRMVHQLGSLLGPQVRDVAQLVVQSRDPDRFALSLSGLIGFIVLFVSASSALSQLQVAIHRIWEVAPPRRGLFRHWLRRRLFSLGMVAVVGFFLVITLVASSLVAALLMHDGPIWLLLNELVAVLVFTLAFAALFGFVPDARQPWRATLLGAFATALMFDAGKWLLGLYLAWSGSADAYGAAGSVVLLLVWVYYSATIVLIGAGVTHWFGERLRTRTPAS